MTLNTIYCIHIWCFQHSKGKNGIVSIHVVERGFLKIPVDANWWYKSEICTKLKNCWNSPDDPLCLWNNNTFNCFQYLLFFGQNRKNRPICWNETAEVLLKVCTTEMAPAGHHCIALLATQHVAGATWTGPCLTWKATGLGNLTVSSILYFLHIIRKAAKTCP